MPFTEIPDARIMAPMKDRRRRLTGSSFSDRFMCFSDSTSRNATARNSRLVRLKPVHQGV